MPTTTIRPDHRYWKVNGFAKKRKEMAIVTAFLPVVTVAANVAPQVRTKVRTI